jgi:hypothetical protein
LFCEDNADVLGRVHSRWQRWLQAHPIGTELDREDAEAEVDVDGWEQDFIVTLAEPPQGSPLDNREQYEHSMPRLLAAVRRWEQILGKPFDWAVTL